MSQAQFQAEVMDELRQQEELEQQQFKEYLAEQAVWFKKTLADFEKMFGGNNDSNI